MAPNASSTESDLPKLAERLARACSDLAIFPATNARVLGQLRSVVGALTERTRRFGRLRIAFHGDTVRVLQDSAPFESGSRLAWVRDRLNAIGAAGLAVEHGLDTDELAAFATRIAEVRPGIAGVRGEPLDVADIAAYGSAHIQILPWRFGVGDGGGEWSEFGDPTGSADRSAFVTTLLDHAPDIGRRIHALQAWLGLQNADALWTGGVETQHFDVLGAIHAALPAEALEDTDACANHVRAALERTATALALPGMRDAIADRADLVRIALDAFRRIDGPLPSQQAEAPPPKPAAARQDPSVAELVAAWNSLPTSDRPPFDDASIDDVGEQAGALLHTLVRSDSAVVRHAVRRTFAARVRANPRAALAELRSWWITARRVGDPNPIARLLALADELGLDERWIGSTPIRAEHVLAAFPELLPRYLRDLPIQQLVADQALPGVVDAVGPAAIRRAADAVPAFPDELAAKLVLRSAPCLVPLWHLLLVQRGDHAAVQVARAVARLGDHFPDADLVQLMLGCGQPVPLDLLLAITSLEAAGARSADTIRAGADALVTLLMSTRRDTDQLGRRRATLLLAPRYAGHRVRHAIAEIAADRGMLGVGGEDPTIREAARRALERLDAQRRPHADV